MEARRPPEGLRSWSAGAARGALAGVAVALGWSLHDLAVLGTNGDPRAALAVLPAHGLACVAAALFGALAARDARSVLVALAGAALLAGAPRLGLRLAPELHELARVLVLAVAALALVVAARRALGRRAVLAGLPLGILACAALVRLRGDPRHVVLPLVLAAGAALVALAVPRAPPRRAALALIALAALVPLARTSARRFPPPRPDLPPPQQPAEPGPSLLLVVLDTVRADRLAPYGHARVTTPRLDAWARAHAVRYTNARSPSSWTLPAHASIFTGLLPGEHGATHVRRAPGEEHPQQHLALPLRPEIPTLAEVLREEGWQTAGIFANHVFLGRDYGLDRGFEHHDARRGSWVGAPRERASRAYRTLVQRAGFALLPGHVPYQDARSVTDRALAWLRGRRPDRFFLALNYMDAHAPLLPPPPFDGLFEERRPRDPLAPEDELLPLLYDRELAFLDAELGRLLDALVELGLHEDMAVVITSDHGEAFGEQGFWHHDWTLYESVVRIPLYVKPVGPRAAETSDEEVSLADVPGLALRALGRDGAPGRGWHGEWYRMASDAVQRGDPRLAGKDLDRDLVAWIEDGLKLIVSSSGEVEAYLLAEDPDERRPVPLAPERVEAARERARAWWAAHPPPSADGPQIGDEELRQMRALGYLGDGE